MKMRRCEDEKMRYRPPLLEEPCAQTLSGKISHPRLTFTFIEDLQQGFNSDDDDDDDDDDASPLICWGTP